MDNEYLQTWRTSTIKRYVDKLLSDIDAIRGLVDKDASIYVTSAFYIPYLHDDNGEYVRDKDGCAVLDPDTNAQIELNTVPTLIRWLDKRCELGLKLSEVALELQALCTKEGYRKFVEEHGYVPF